MDYSVIIHTIFFQHFHVLLITLCLDPSISSPLVINKIILGFVSYRPLAVPQDTGTYLYLNVDTYHLVSNYPFPLYPSDPLEVPLLRFLLAFQKNKTKNWTHLRMGVREWAVKLFFLLLINFIQHDVFQVHPFV